MTVIISYCSWAGNTWWAINFVLWEISEISRVISRKFFWLRTAYHLGRNCILAKMHVYAAAKQVRMHLKQCGFSDKDLFIVFITLGTKCFKAKLDFGEPLLLHTRNYLEPSDFGPKVSGQNKWVPNDCYKNSP